MPCGDAAASVVPLDRANPAAGSIRIAFYVSPHTGSGRALEPIFITPGGPGESGWSTRFFYEKAPQLSVRHDLVLIDPRGTGRSGVIECADLQNGLLGTTRRSTRPSPAARASSARRPTATARATWPSTSRTCARPSATTRSTTTRSRTGRCPSRATRHGSRSTFTRSRSTPGWSTDRAFYAWGLGVPQGLVRIERLLCRRDPSCHGDVAAAIRYLAARVRAQPVKGRRMIVDEVELINLLSHGGDEGKMAPPKPCSRSRPLSVAATRSRCSSWRCSTRSGPPPRRPRRRLLGRRQHRCAVQRPAPALEPGRPDRGPAKESTRRRWPRSPSRPSPPSPRTAGTSSTSARSA